MTNADKFKEVFGIYATELWAMPEADFLKWLNTDRKTEPNSSEFPNNCETCRFEIYCPEMCEGCCEWDSHYEPKTEPQTETEIAKAIVHKMIDDTVIAEDAYPDLRQKMHDAVDEYEPQTERSNE